LLKAVIIEDDYDTRIGLMDMINWKSMGIELCGSAENGRVGLELARRVRPEIAILDVRMPLLNGIECAREIRKFLPQCNIIFLSGYCDKEYLKEAIKLHAVEYLEKPVDLDELNALLVKTTEKFKIEQFRISNSVPDIVQLQKIVAKTSEYINKWVNNQLDKECFCLWLSQMQIDMDPDAYYRSFYTVCRSKYTLEADISVEVSRNLKDMFTDHSFIIHPYDRGLLTIAECGFSTEEAISCKIAEKINEVCEAIYHLPFMTAMSLEKAGYSSVAEQFRKLKKSIPLCLKYEKSTVITQSMLSKSKSKLSEAHVNNIIHLTSAGKAQEAQSELKELEKFAYDAGYDDIERVQRLFLYLYFSLHSLFSQKGIIEQKDVFNEIVNNFENLSDMAIPKLVRLCMEKIKNLSSLSSDFRTINPKVRKAILYMQENYSEDISLDMIAHAVNISPAYLSSIFKKETGKNVIQYLEDIRITKAFSLLNDSDLSITDISRMVGYNTPHYFAQIFKKLTGVSPSQYRK